MTLGSVGQGSNRIWALDDGQSSSGCTFCDSGLPTIKLKRQYIHRIGWKNIICSAKGMKPMSEGSKRRG